MPELAEGARLEIVCTSKQRTVGSNPTLSAIFSGTEACPWFVVRGSSLSVEDLGIQENPRETPKGPPS